MPKNSLTYKSRGSIMAPADDWIGIQHDAEEYALPTYKTVTA